MYAEFVITDEDTGVEYITQFRVTVSSVYERGWMLLADQGETSMLSLVRNDKIVYEDAYRLANDADLAGGAVGLYDIGRLGRKMWDRCLWLARKDRNIP